MALVAVSAAFPAEAKAVTAQLHDWFDRATPPLRTALGLALGFHGLVDEAVAEIVVDEVGQSNTWATRSGGLIVFAPNDSPFPRPGEEPYFDSPVPEAIRVAERLRAGAEEQTGGFHLGLQLPAHIDGVRRPPNRLAQLTPGWDSHVNLDDRDSLCRRMPWRWPRSSG